MTKEERFEAAATAYINFFSHLGTTDDTGEIDFLFVENLMHATGNKRLFLLILTCTIFLLYFIAEIKKCSIF